MIVDKRIACRSIISVNLIIAGISLNKKYTVMLFYKECGELLIEMEDNVYCRNNDGYFLSLFFCALILVYKIQYISASISL
ncbi:hypothetical protein CWR48_10290 [Oceanobacillus arenosus]|uniref:Uncharacterized protein n=1 Tax=Oceanobacillus arenosus TaxID=1229153 RepID=A0A3D8PRT3_9BACI|nr:hypothetical protein CWR48_10290 [Oceanobacillus arenosus]